MGVDSWPTGGPTFSAAGGSVPSGRPIRATPGAATRSARLDETTLQRPRPGVAQGPNAAGTVRRVPNGAARHRSAAGTARRSGPLGDARGLTAVGALVLLLVAGLVGALVDQLLGHGLWVAFSIAFVAAVLLNGFRAHLEDLAASVVMVPIAYAVTGTLSSILGDIGSLGSLRQELLSASGVLVFGTPILLLSSVTAAAIALSRWRSVMVARRRARNRAVRRAGAVPTGRPRAEVAATRAGTRRR